MLSPKPGLSQRPEHRIISLRTAGLAIAGVAALALLPSSAAAFVTIPEEEVISREGQRDVINIRVQEGCTGQTTDIDAATDRIEVEVPDSVVAVIPSAVPGWTAATESVDTEPYELFGQRQTERVSRVIWTGGPLAPDAYLDFGINAVFMEPTDELVFPVVQGCGDIEHVWDELPAEGENRADLRFPAPVVAVVELTLEAEVAELRQELETFRTEVEELKLTDIGETPMRELRERIRELERRLDDAEERLDEAETAQS